MNFLTTTLPLTWVFVYFCRICNSNQYVQNGFSVGSYSLMLSFLMNQIVIDIKKENVLTYLTLFDNRPESCTVFSETRLRDKELGDPGYTAKTDTIPKKKLTRHLL